MRWTRLGESGFLNPPGYFVHQIGVEKLVGRDSGAGSKPAL